MVESIINRMFTVISERIDHTNILTDQKRKLGDKAAAQEVINTLLHDIAYLDSSIVEANALREKAIVNAIQADIAAKDFGKKERNMVKEDNKKIIGKVDDFIKFLTNSLQDANDHLTVTRIEFANIK